MTTTLRLQLGECAKLSGVDEAMEHLIRAVRFDKHHVFAAIEGLTYKQNKKGKFLITGGKAIWKGQDKKAAQEQINTWGISAFLKEAQHEVDAKGGMYDHIEFRHCERTEMPDLVRTTVWVDPAVTSTDHSDSMGIQADGIDEEGIIYRLFSWEGITSPEKAIRRAVLKAIELGSMSVGIETDQGGDTWQSVYSRVCEKILKELEATQEDIPEDERETISLPGFAQDKAGAGHGNKVHRGQQMLVDYENGMIVHVRGTHGQLEKSLGRFPRKPLDLADAAYWSWADLRERINPRDLYAFMEA